MKALKGAGFPLTIKIILYQLSFSWVIINIYLTQNPLGLNSKDHPLLFSFIVLLNKNQLPTVPLEYYFIKIKFKEMLHYPQNPSLKPSPLPILSLSVLKIHPHATKNYQVLAYAQMQWNLIHGGASTHKVEISFDPWKCFPNDSQKLIFENTSLKQKTIYSYSRTYLLFRIYFLHKSSKTSTNILSKFKKLFSISISISLKN